MPKRTDVAALGARLLDAQVAFEVAQLLDPVDFENAVVEEVDHFLAMADELTLGEAISADPVKDVARKYAVQIPVEGAIPELVGEIARQLYRHGTGGEYRLADVIDDRHFDELATAISEMGLTRRLVRRVLEGSATIETAVEVVTRAVDALLDDPDEESVAADLPTRVRERAAHGLRGAVRPARPVIDSVVERVTRSGATFVLRGNEPEAGELLLESVRDVWRNNRDASLRTFRELVTEEDVDDIIVLVFEFWREFRGTPFVHMLLDDAVGYVFEKYGDTPLSELLGELGVFREDLIEEGMRFGPAGLAKLHEIGYLETVVRRRLAPFYSSEAFRAALDQDSR